MMIMCLSILPSFASANEYDYLQGKEVVDSSYKKYKELTDGNENTYLYLKPSESYKFTFDDFIKDSMRVDVVFDKPLVLGDYVYLTFKYNNSNVLNTNLLYGKSKVTFMSSNINFNSLTLSAGRLSSSDIKVKEIRMYDSSYTPEIQDLKSVEGINEVSFSWKNPDDPMFTGLKIYCGDTLVTTLKSDVTSYKVTDLDSNKNYSFRFSSLYGVKESLGVQKGVKTLVDPKRVPPGPVSSLTAEPTDKTVKLKWKSPKDDDLAGFKILQNGKQVAEIGLEEEFTVKNLEPLTDYTFGVIAVDRDKNDSTPVSLSVKTLEENDNEPPLVPSNVFAKPSNGVLIASWDKVSDKDLAGYNVYLDDKKINSNLISSTNFTIKNLENNRKYKIQVQAVDRSGNASALSLAAYGTPDENTIPIIESKYSLQDVSDGVNVMFGQFWLVLAFAVGIPLAFYIIYKLKLTVLP